MSNQLTIGGAEPLGQDAIDKLQAQIISPSQTIYVDSINGNDDNNGEYGNPVKTLDKAAMLIKKDVSSVYIILDNSYDDMVYTFSNSCFISNNNNLLHISAKDYNSAINNRKRIPTIELNLSKIPDSTPRKYIVGYILTYNFESVTLLNVNIKYPDEAIIKTNIYTQEIFSRCSNLSLNTNCVLNLISNAVIVNPIIEDNNLITMDTTTINAPNDNSCYLARANSLITSIPEGSENNEEEWSYYYRSEKNAVFTNISQSRSSISNLSTNKIYSDCHALYSNIVT